LPVQHERGGRRIDNAEYVNPLYIVSFDAVVPALERDHEPHEVFPAGFGEWRK
jgi:hypothetical protein